MNKAELVAAVAAKTGDTKKAAEASEHQLTLLYQQLKNH